MTCGDPDLQTTAEVVRAAVQNGADLIELGIPFSDLGAIVQVIRQNTDVPCAIGFGISTPEQAKRMAELSDGAIVGSAIVRLIATHGTQAAPYVGEYVRTMKQAL